MKSFLLTGELLFAPQVLKVSGEWRVASDSQCFTEEIKSYEAISYEVIGLHPDTRYRMQVRAHNILGFSKPAHLYVQTALGEYNQENNEVPLRAGFYDVYTAPNPYPSAAFTAASSSLIVFALVSLFL